MTDLNHILQSIKERADRATEGPWKSRLNHRPYKIVWIDQKEGYSTLELKPADADFIAASRTDVPRLVEAVEVLAEELQARKHKLSTAEDADHALQRATEILKGG